MYIKIVTSIIITTILCQNIVLADNNCLAPQSELGEALRFAKEVKILKVLTDKNANPREKVSRIKEWEGLRGGYIAQIEKAEEMVLNKIRIPMRLAEKGDNNTRELLLELLKNVRQVAYPALTQKQALMRYLFFTSNFLHESIHYLADNILSSERDKVLAEAFSVLSDFTQWSNAKVYCNGTVTSVELCSIADDKICKEGIELIKKGNVYARLKENFSPFLLDPIEEDYDNGKRLAGMAWQIGKETGDIEYAYLYLRLLLAGYDFVEAELITRIEVEYRRHLKEQRESDTKAEPAPLTADSNAAAEGTTAIVRVRMKDAWREMQKEPFQPFNWPKLIRGLRNYPLKIIIQNIRQEFSNPIVELGILITVADAAFEQGFSAVHGAITGSYFFDSMPVDIVNIERALYYVSSLFGGVLEEIVFRIGIFGLLLKYLQSKKILSNKFSFALAAVISTFAWVIVHQGVSVSFIILNFLVGITYAYVYWKTSRVGIMIISHVSYNFTIMLIVFCFNLLDLHSFYWLVIISNIVLGSLWLANKYFNRVYPTTEQDIPILPPKPEDPLREDTQPAVAAMPDEGGPDGQAIMLAELKKINQTGTAAEFVDYVQRITSDESLTQNPVLYDILEQLFTAGLRRINKFLQSGESYSQEQLDFERTWYGLRIILGHGQIPLAQCMFKLGGAINSVVRELDNESTQRNIFMLKLEFNKLYFRLVAVKHAILLDEQAVSRLKEYQAEINKIRDDLERIFNQVEGIIEAEYSRYKDKEDFVNAYRLMKEYGLDFRKDLRYLRKLVGKTSDKSEFSLGELFDAIYDNLRLYHRGGRLVEEGDIDYPQQLRERKVSADLDLFSFALARIFSNVIKHDGLKPKLDLEESDFEYVLTVECKKVDEAEDLKRLTEFNQHFGRQNMFLTKELIGELTEYSDEDKGKGLGMNLLWHIIVGMHGGSVDIRYDAQKGSLIYTIKLPKQACEKAESGQAENGSHLFSPFHKRIAQIETLYYGEMTRRKLFGKGTQEGSWLQSRIDRLFEIMELLNLPKGKKFIDLGSGDGRAVIIASIFGLNATGYEADNELFLFGLDMERKILGSNGSVDFRNRDFLKDPNLNIKEYDVIFYYTAGSEDEERMFMKIVTEMRNDSLLIVYGSKPDPYFMGFPFIDIGHAYIFYRPNSSPPVIQKRESVRFTPVGGVENHEYVSLAGNKVSEPPPKETYRIKEGYTGVVRYSGGRPYMITCGLYSCAAVTFYDPKTKTGLLSHLSHSYSDSTIVMGEEKKIVNMDQYVLFLLDEFLQKGASFDDLEITVIWGPDRNEYAKRRMTELVSSLKKIRHNRFSIDSTKDTETRGVSLNLTDGKVEEMRMPGIAWSWSDEYDVSINVPNQELSAGGKEGQIISILDAVRGGAEKIREWNKNDLELLRELLNNVISYELKDNRIYEIRYDAERLSVSQRDIIEVYAEVLKKKVPNPDNIKIMPFRGERRDYVIKVVCKDRDRNITGEGQIDVVLEGELGEYPLRIIGMLNIALASANVPSDLANDQVEGYRPVLEFIKYQYKAITGSEFVVPDSAEGILKAIRKIVLDLPKIEKMSVGEVDELNISSREILLSA